MANPTTNYGFVLPTSTDLVTDLPADFDVALQGVDTRLKALQPGTTLGDLMYASATANTNTRLGIGSNGQVLSISGGVPVWATTADQTPLTTKGDLFTFTTVDARLGVGANNTVLTADSSEATGLKWATPAGGGGKILQVVQATTSTTVTVTGLTYADSGLTATITPTSATSKIMAIVTQRAYWSSPSGQTNNYCGMKLLRGATAIVTNSTDSFGWYASSVSAYIEQSSYINLAYLDSPATTSATTYKTQFAYNGSTGTVRTNDNLSILLLLEVGA